MENNELQNIWKSAGSDSSQRSKIELDLLLRSKVRETVYKYRSIAGISIVISLVVIILLIIATINRQGDTLYMINNISLGILTLISLFSGILSWNKLQVGKFDMPLKSVLEDKIRILSIWLKGGLSKIYFISVPILYILCVISIHVYFENKALLDVFKTYESLIGLIIAAPIGLFLAFYVVRKIRRSQDKNLDFMKDMYARLVD